MEARLTLQSLDGAPPQPVAIRLASGTAARRKTPVECAFARILEVRIPLAGRGCRRRRRRALPVFAVAEGLPMDAVPQQGWLEMPTTDPAEMADSSAAVLDCRSYGNSECEAVPALLPDLQR